MSGETRYVLITGANRGLGLHSARLLARRGWSVIAACRKPEAAAPAAEELRAHGATVVRLDVTDPESVTAAVHMVRNTTRKLHALVNNAGIFEHAEEHLPDAPAAITRDLLLTNAWGPLTVTQQFLPLLRAADGASVVNVTSQDVDPENLDGTFTGYCMSKAALNVMTANLALALRPDRIVVNGVDPGWIPTDMGGPDAPDDVTQAARTVATAVELAGTGRSGEILRAAN
ncbi:SDR family NAD(P)-dependent oxidoreductase [Streptomyces sp. NPDC059788]|uniref:SDR family NAD(P)-dependent oxidoreductase n=1 Tax=Streptomyces sp. NPDC059788 TaxID=3346948 RepID=UPI0036477A5A